MHVEARIKGRSMFSATLSATRLFFLTSASRKHSKRVSMLCLTEPTQVRIRFSASFVSASDNGSVLGDRCVRDTGRERPIFAAVLGLSPASALQSKSEACPLVCLRGRAAADIKLSVGVHSRGGMLAAEAEMVRTIGVASPCLMCRWKPSADRGQRSLCT